MEECFAFVDSYFVADWRQFRMPERITINRNSSDDGSRHKRSHAATHTATLICVIHLFLANGWGNLAVRLHEIRRIGDRADRHSIARLSLLRVADARLLPPIPLFHA